MAIKKLTELPRGKRATVKQVEKARKAKAIQVKPRVIGVRHGRMEINLGTHDKDDIAGVIKGFRQKYKADFGAIIKDEDGNVIARTHTASGKTTLPEQLAVKALSKYAKQFDRIKIVLSAKQPKRGKPITKAKKKPTKKKAVKKLAKKQAVKKPTKKKAIKKPVKKQVVKKPTKKKATKKARKK